MQPDLVRQNKVTKQIIVLDTKFTPHSLKENQWGKSLFDSSHLYQIYSYLGTQEHLSEEHLLATGILLYPAIDDQLSESVDLQNHQIRIESVNLAAHWQIIENRLFDLALNLER